MHDRVTAARWGVGIGLCYLMPLLVWLLGLVYLGSAGPQGLAVALETMLITLLLMQSWALALCLPWLMRFPVVLERCIGVAMMLMVPAPLYAVAWIGGAADAANIVLGIFLLIGLALIFHSLYAACLALISPGQLRASSLLVIQFTLIGLCWHFQYLWHQVLIP